MEKLIITAAVTGASIISFLSPYLPITSKQVADSAVESATAGTTVVHIHARRPEDGYPSSDPKHLPIGITSSRNSLLRSLKKSFHLSPFLK